MAGSLQHRLHFSYHSARSLAENGICTLRTDQVAHALALCVREQRKNGGRKRKKERHRCKSLHCTSACLHCNAGGCANGNATCSHLVGRFKDGYGSPLAAATAAATFFVPFPLLRGDLPDLPAPFGLRVDFAFAGAAFGAAAVPVDLRAATITKSCLCVSTTRMKLTSSR